MQSVEAMMELGPREKEEFLTEIYKALASISTLRDKVRDQLGRHMMGRAAGACIVEPRLPEPRQHTMRSELAGF